MLVKDLKTLDRRIYNSIHRNIWSTISYSINRFEIDELSIKDVVDFYELHLEKDPYGIRWRGFGKKSYDKLITLAEES